MKIYQKLSYCIVICFASVHFSYAQVEGELIDKIIAKADNYILLKSELEAMYFQLVVDGQVKENSRKDKCALLESLLINKMMLAQAEIDSIIVSEDEVERNLDRRFKAIMGQIGGDEEQLQKIYGKTVGDLRNELKEQIHEQLTVQRMRQEITANVPKPTPKEVKKFFSSIPKDSLPYFEAEIEYAHIVKIPEVSKAIKTATRSKLEEIRQKIVNGTSFEAMAKEHSDDVQNAGKGGDLGWQGRGTFVTAFEATALRLKPGEMSEVIETQFGYHIIKLIDRRGDEFRCAHILKRINWDLVDVGEAKDFLDSLRTVIVNDSIPFYKAAKEFSQDQFTAPNGGDIPGPGGALKVSTKDLEPPTYFMLDSMKVGDISKPIRYRTDDGKSAVRIVLFKNKIAPHQASLEKDYEKIFNFTYNSKKNEAIQEWFKETRNQLYIVVDEAYKDCNVLRGTQ